MCQGDDYRIGIMNQLHAPADWKFDESRGRQVEEKTNEQ
jgi:hypothetical protein